MLSKMVVDRTRSARIVSAVAIKHTIAIVPAYEALFQPLLREDETMPDLRLVLALFGRHLDRRRVDMVAADEAYVLEIQEDNGLRAQRDALVESLSVKVSEVRGVFASLFGEEAGRTILGIQGRTSQDPEHLVRQAGHLIHIFSERPSEIPDIFEGLSVQPERWAERLRPETEELAALLQALRNDASETGLALVTKNETMGSFDGDFPNIAMVVQGFHGLGGQNELAARVRPSRRRPGRTDQEVAEEEGGGLTDGREDPDDTDQPVDEPPDTEPDDSEDDGVDLPTDEA